MHDSLLVCRGKPPGDLNPILDGLPYRERTPSHPLPKRPPLEKLRDYERTPFVLAEVVDRENVWVVQRARGPRLLLEAAKAIGTCSRSSRKNLRSNVAMENFVMGAVHHTHPTGTDLLEDSVVGERFAKQGIHCPPW